MTLLRYKAIYPVIPLDMFFLGNQAGKYFPEGIRVEWAGAINTVRGFTNVSTQLCGCQPVGANQAVLGRQHSAATITQLVAGAISLIAQAPDPVGVGAGQQNAQHISLCHTNGKLAGLVNSTGEAGEAPRLLPYAFEPRLEFGWTSGFTHQHRNGDTNIYAARAQGIALRQYRRKQARCLSSVNITANQQHMGEAWVQGHLRQADAVWRKLVIAGVISEYRTTLFQNRYSLAIGCRGGRVQPRQR